MQAPRGWRPGDGRQCVSTVCRYEVQGEYVIPSSTTIPRSALSFAKAAAPQAGRPAQDEQAASSGSFEAGRWRVQVQHTPLLLDRRCKIGLCVQCCCLNICTW